MNHTILIIKQTFSLTPLLASILGKFSVLSTCSTVYFSVYLAAHWCLGHDAPKGLGPIKIEFPYPGLVHEWKVKGKKKKKR